MTDASAAFLIGWRGFRSMIALPTALLAPVLRVIAAERPPWFYRPRSDGRADYSTHLTCSPRGKDSRDPFGRLPDTCDNACWLMPSGVDGCALSIHANLFPPD